MNIGNIKTPIIPKAPTFVEIEGANELDLKAICIFVATGFFLDTDTYFQHQKVLSPASIHTFNNKGKLIESKPWFKWHYSPREIPFEKALDEFSILFEKILDEQTKGKSVILPLSGGLDSRTQAVALKNHSNVHSYSYSFKNGFPEHKIGKKIAESLGFQFDAFQIEKGYLWNCIEDLASINKCYSDFTHPRQMAFIEQFKKMGNVFSLGHWGDVLFDSLNSSQLNLEEEMLLVLKKIIKKGGLEFATSLWESWGLDGDFKSYLINRIKILLNEIEIKDTNAKIRAFKSLYWAPRWTATNLSIFEKETQIVLPYFDNRMCEFICTVPEAYLQNRKLQIAYIKRKSPELAKITWQEQKPFNLSNYHLNKVPYNLPYRLSNKIFRTGKALLGKPHVSRNWELQFLGKENDGQLRKWLFESDLNSLIPEQVIQQFYTNFIEKDQVTYSHPMSMLLTLSLFNQKFNK